MGARPFAVSEGVRRTSHRRMALGRTGRDRTARLAADGSGGGNFYGRSRHGTAGPQPSAAYGCPTHRAHPHKGLDTRPCVGRMMEKCRSSK
ncbi:hypothetical protein HEK131_10130 [Streptomyces seoulensis]|nr:hypothetical protein HEK131_10130 [Streptomyces seoulensis]